MLEPPDAYTHDMHLRSLSEDADSEQDEERLRIAGQAHEDAALDRQNYPDDK